ncbi:hypothetical protein SUGI_1026160 [Cryptomeria japonica]|nr:hypothetical protein SUGI_1026160 [Cryptomeria japonica]
MERVFSMNAGNGDYSYAQNSTWQKDELLRAKSELEECIKSWKTILECETLCIADLGCSCGPNALLITEIITTLIRNKYAHNGIRVPDFHVFYNDLPSTDFNTLFRLLSAAPPVETSYFAAGVPGSFYTRLFPPKSLHFVHSSFSLHWLSQVPPQVEDKNSKLWNKGRIYISEKGPAGIEDAYFAQFQEDFNCFLRARAKEVVEGGRMFLVLNGRLNAGRRRPTSSALCWEALGFAIQDLVSQGLIEEEKLNSFNMPYYDAFEDELRSEVDKEGSFNVVGLKVNINYDDLEEFDDKDKGIIISKQTRALLENLISYHFGEGVVDALFNRYSKVIAANIIQIDELLKESTSIILALERAIST